MFANEENLKIYAQIKDLEEQRRKARSKSRKEKLSNQIEELCLKLKKAAELELNGEVEVDGKVRLKSKEQAKYELTHCSHIAVPDPKSGEIYLGRPKKFVCPNCGCVIESSNGVNYAAQMKTANYVTVYKHFFYDGLTIINERNKKINFDPISGFQYPSGLVDYSLMYLRARAELEDCDPSHPNFPFRIRYLMDVYIEEAQKKNEAIARKIINMKYGL